MTTSTRAFMLCAAVASASQGAWAAFGDNAVGINTHVPPDDVIDACVDLGVRWIRVDNNWLEHQPSAGPPAFGAYLDDAASHAVASGLGVYMTVAYTPAWASSGDTDGTSLNDVPVAGAYGSYVRQAVAHYRALGVTHFGLWNEPNLAQFWEGTASQYVDRVVVEGIAAIGLGCADAGRSDCMALGPDLAHLDDVDVWLEDILAAMDSRGASFDIYAHHNYGGFPEIGDEIWDGDRFFNVLDQRRFVFTRRSFLDVLVESGHAPLGFPDREVWITETGYKCVPPTDAGEMDRQEIYYMRVIDEQLARAWYTNTFFYEIQDSFDTLDGFGIIRRTSGPDSTWTDNFILKDAFLALRARIDSEPALQETPCGLECCDGLDNDGDTLADMADPGCSTEDDDDESDEVPPPMPEIQAARSDAVVLDGALDEWTAASFVSLVSPDDFVSPDHPAPDASDLSCRFSAMWSPSALYIGIEVTDDVHENSSPPDSIWLGDSVQAAFDMARNGGTSYDATDDWEMGWARTDSGDVSHRWAAPTAAPPFSSTVSTQVTSTGVTYEAMIPAADLGTTAFSEGQQAGFTILVNDADGDGREGWIEWTPGIGAFKDPSSFGILRLVAVPAPEPDDAEPAPDIEEPLPDAPDGNTDAPPDALTDPVGSGSGGCGCALAR